LDENACSEVLRIPEPIGMPRDHFLLAICHPKFGQEPKNPERDDMRRNTVERQELDPSGFIWLILVLDVVKPREG